MRKTVLTIGFTALILVPAHRAQALVGIGINVGQDGYTVAPISLTLFSTLSLTTTEIKNPLGIGGYLYIDAIPIIDLEIGTQVYGSKMDVTYKDQSLGELAWGRTAAYVTVQKKLFKVPMFSVFAGAGLSFHGSVPLNAKGLEKFLGDANADLDVKELAKNLDKATGVHIELGARFKPLLIPFAVNAKYRLYLADGVVPGEKSFSTISLGVGFQI